jgi:ApaG protein
MSAKHQIAITVRTWFVDDQSEPAQSRYVFAYNIKIENQGEVPAQLISRHWVITDETGKVQEVRGEGVIGEQPHLRPGESFEYTSGAVLETSLGTMRGSYHMQADDGLAFDAEIAPFTLCIPRTLH